MKVNNLSFVLLFIDVFPLLRNDFVSAELAKPSEAKNA
jgi:hypothetical protein